MWKAAFTGRSERSETGSTVGERERSGKERKKRSSRSSTVGGDDDTRSMASGASSRRHKSSKSEGGKSRSSGSNGRERGLTESAIQMLDREDDDGGWEDEGRVRGDGRDAGGKRRERERSRSRSRSRERSGKMPEKRKSARSGELVDERRTGSYDEPYAAPPRITMSGALPSNDPAHQFPDQNPDTYAHSAFRPGAADERKPAVPTRGMSFGAASEYYLDEGQSVRNQPGVRAHTPNMLQNAAPHLQTASVEANPAQDTGTGAAAEFYEGRGGARGSPRVEKKSDKRSSDSDNKGRKGERRSSGKAQTTSSLSTYAKRDPAPSSQRKPPSTSGEASSYYQDPGSYSAVSSMPPSVMPTSSLAEPPSSLPSYAPPRPMRHNSEPVASPQGGYYAPPPEITGRQAGKQPSQPHTNVPLYAAGAAAAATGVGYAAHEMNQRHDYQGSTYSTTAAGSAYGAGNTQYTSRPEYQNGSGNMQPQTHPSHHHRHHEHRGPLTRFKDGLLNLVSSPEDVRRMEEYTEYIGVCKYCFDPNSSPSNGPRRHFYGAERERLRRQGSGGSLNGRRRVDKKSRYSAGYGGSGSSSSSDDERKGSRFGKTGLAAAGLGAAGLAVGANAMFNGRKDFDDTYSVQSGHRASSAVRRRSRSSERDRRSKGQYGSVRRSDGKQYVGVQRLDGQMSDSRYAAGGAALSAGAFASGSVMGRQHEHAQGAFVRPHRPSSSSSSSSSSGIRSPGLADIFRFTDRKAKRREQKRRASPSNSRYSSSNVRGNIPSTMPGGFYTSPPRPSRRDSRRQERRTGFFNFGNGSASSSSSDSDLAFGSAVGGSSKHGSRQNLPLRQQQQQRKASRKTSDERMNAAMLGIGATAAALAAAQAAKKGSSGRISKRPSRQGLRTRQQDPRTQRRHAEEDEEWEDELPSDVDDASSVGSGLAFGDDRRLTNRQSMDSLNSQASSNASGLGAWGWRWGSKKDKGKKRQQQQRIEPGPVYPTRPDAIASAGFDGTPSATYPPQQPLPGPKANYAPTESVFSTATAPQPMSFIDPRPLSETSSTPQGSRHTSMPGSFVEEPALIGRPGPSPIQQPQPITPITSGFMQHTPPSRDRDTRPLPRRTQSSPVYDSKWTDAAMAAGVVGAGVLTASALSGASGSGSKGNVRFGLTDEQEGKDKKRRDEERRKSDRKRAVDEEADRAKREQEDSRMRREEEALRRQRESEEGRRREEEARVRDEEMLRIKSEKEAVATRERERRDAAAREAKAAEARAQLEREFQAREVREREERERLGRERAEAEQTRFEREEHDRRQREREDYESQQREREDHEREQREHEDYERQQREREDYDRQQRQRENYERAQSTRSRSDSRSERSQPRGEPTRRPSSPTSETWKRTAGAAGAAAAAAAGGAAIVSAMRSRSDSSSNRHSPPVSPPAQEITPSNEHSGTPLQDDDLFDPDFFKRKRSASELTRYADLARKATDKVVQDMESRYAEPNQSQADFFYPTGVLDRDSKEAKTKVADPMGDNYDVQVWRVGDDTVAGDQAEREIFDQAGGFEAASGKGKGRGNSKKDSRKGVQDEPRFSGVPTLNVIAPTPPTSTTGSTDGRSAPPSPLVEAQGSRNERDENTRPSASGRSVSWGADQMHEYEARTPDSHVERDEYMQRHEVPEQEPLDRVPVVVEPAYDSYYDTNGSRRDSRDEIPQTSAAGSFYQQPFAQTVSDIGFAIDSPGTEGAPPVRGFVEGETNEPTPGLEREMHIPGGFDEDPAAETPREEPRQEEDLSKLSKKERKKREKEMQRAQTETAMPDEPSFDLSQDEPPAAEPEAAWEPPMSKKDKKKREKAAKRGESFNESHDMASPAPEERELPPSVPVETPAPAEEEYFPLVSSSKKDKKKKKKGAQQFDDYAESSGSGAQTPAEQVPIPEPIRDLPESSQAAAEAESAWEPPLSKKDKKKRDKAAKQSAFDEPALSEPQTPAEDFPLPETPRVEPLERQVDAGAEDAWEPPLSKKEKKKREKAAKQGAFDEAVTSESQTPAEEFPLPETPHDVFAYQINDTQADDAWEPPLSKKDKKKREKAAKNGGTEDFGEPSPVAAAVIEPLAPEQPPTPAEEDVWEPPLSKKEKKKREKEQRAAASSADAADDYPAPSPPMATPHGMPGEWTQTPAEEISRDFPSPAPTNGSSSKEADPWSEFAEPAKKGKKDKKKKRDSERFNEPAASSPLRSEVAFDDYVGSNGQPDDRNVVESPRGMSPTEAQSVVSAPAGDSERRRSKSSRSRREIDYPEEGGAYDDTRSVAASEPADYESGKKERRRRSKYEDDDTASVTSSRSRREKDESPSKEKKEKKGGLFGLFGRKSSDSVPKVQEADDEERKHRKKKHRSGSEYGDDDTRSVASESRSKHRSSRDDKYDEDSRERDRHHRRHRSGETGDDYDDSRSAVTEPGPRRSKRDSEDYRSPSIASEGRDRHHRRHRSGENGEDQSFLGSRVEEDDLPPLPPSAPASPGLVAVEDDKEQSFGSSGSATGLGEQQEKILEEAGVEPAKSREMAAPTVQGEFDTAASAAREETETAALTALPASEPSSPTAVAPETPLRPPMQPARPASSTAIPLRFRTFPHSPSTQPKTSRSASFSAPVATTTSPTSPVSSTKEPRTHRPRSTEFRHSQEIRPLYLVERNRKPTESEKQREAPETLPSLPSSKPSSRASSLHGSEDWHSAAEDQFTSPTSPLSVRGGEPLSIDTSRANTFADFNEDVLGSQQATPRAVEVEDPVTAVVSGNGRERGPRQEPQYWTWDDLAKEQGMQNAEPASPSSSLGVEHHQRGQKVESEREWQAVDNAPASPTESLAVEHHSRKSEVAGAAVVGALVGAAAAGLADRGKHQSHDEAAAQAQAQPQSSSPGYFDDQAPEAPAAAEPEASAEPSPTPERPSLSRKGSSKKGVKKGKKGKEPALGTTTVSDPNAATQLSAEEQKQIEAKDVESMVDDWFAPATPVAEGYKKKKGKKGSVNESLIEPTAEDNLALGLPAEQAGPVQTSTEGAAAVASTERALPADEPSDSTTDVAIQNDFTVPQSPVSTTPSPLLTRKQSKKGKKKQRGKSVDYFGEGAASEQPGEEQSASEQAVATNQSSTAREDTGPGATVETSTSTGEDDKPEDIPLPLNDDISADADLLQMPASDEDTSVGNEVDAKTEKTFARSSDNGLADEWASSASSSKKAKKDKKKKKRFDAYAEPENEPTLLGDGEAHATTELAPQDQVPDQLSGQTGESTKELSNEILPGGDVDAIVHESENVSDAKPTGSQAVEAPEIAADARIAPLSGEVDDDGASRETPFDQANTTTEEPSGDGNTDPPMPPPAEKQDVVATATTDAAERSTSEVSNEVAQPAESGRGWFSSWFSRGKKAEQTVETPATSPANSTPAGQSTDEDLEAPERGKSLDDQESQTHASSDQTPFVEQQAIIRDSSSEKSTEPRESPRDDGADAELEAQPMPDQNTQEVAGDVPNDAAGTSYDSNEPEPSAVPLPVPDDMAEEVSTLEQPTDEPAISQDVEMQVADDVHSAGTAPESRDQPLDEQLQQESTADVPLEAEATEEPDEDAFWAASSTKKKGKKDKKAKNIAVEDDAPKVTSPTEDDNSKELEEPTVEHDAPRAGETKSSDQGTVNPSEQIDDFWAPQTSKKKGKKSKRGRATDDDLSKVAEQSTSNTEASDARLESQKGDAPDDNTEPLTEALPADPPAETAEDIWDVPTSKKKGKKAKKAKQSLLEEPVPSQAEHDPALVDQPTQSKAQLDVSSAFADPGAGPAPSDLPEGVSDLTPESQDLRAQEPNEAEGIDDIWSAPLSKKEKKSKKKAKLAAATSERSDGDSSPVPDRQEGEASGLGEEASQNDSQPSNPPEAERSAESSANAFSDHNEQRATEPARAPNDHTALSATGDLDSDLSNARELQDQPLKESSNEEQIAQYPDSASTSTKERGEPGDVANSVDNAPEYDQKRSSIGAPNDEIDQASLASNQPESVSPEKVAQDDQATSVSALEEFPLPSEEPLLSTEDPLDTEADPRNAPDEASNDLAARDTVRTPSHEAEVDDSWDTPVKSKKGKKNKKAKQALDFAESTGSTEPIQSSSAEVMNEVLSEPIAQPPTSNEAAGESLDSAEPAAEPAADDFWAPPVKGKKGKKAKKSKDMPSDDVPDTADQAPHDLPNTAVAIKDDESTTEQRNDSPSEQQPSTNEAEAEDSWAAPTSKKKGKKGKKNKAVGFDLDGESALETETNESQALAEQLPLQGSTSSGQEPEPEPDVSASVQEDPYAEQLTSPAELDQSAIPEQEAATPVQVQDAPEPSQHDVDADDFWAAPVKSKKGKKGKKGKQTTPDNETTATDALESQPTLADEEGVGSELPSTTATDATPREPFEPQAEPEDEWAAPTNSKKAKKAKKKAQAALYDVKNSVPSEADDSATVEQAQQDARTPTQSEMPLPAGPGDDIETHESQPASSDADMEGTQPPVNQTDEGVQLSGEPNAQQTSGEQPQASASADDNFWAPPSKSKKKKGKKSKEGTGVEDPVQTEVENEEPRDTSSGEQDQSEAVLESKPDDEEQVAVEANPDDTWSMPTTTKKSKKGKKSKKTTAEEASFDFPETKAAEPAENLKDVPQPDELPDQDTGAQDNLVAPQDPAETRDLAEQSNEPAQNSLSLPLDEDIGQASQADEPEPVEAQTPADHDFWATPAKSKKGKKGKKAKTSDAASDLPPSTDTVASEQPTAEERNTGLSADPAETVHPTTTSGEASDRPLDDTGETSVIGSGTAPSEDTSPQDVVDFAVESAVPQDATEQGIDNENPEGEHTTLAEPVPVTELTDAPMEDVHRSPNFEDGSPSAEDDSNRTVPSQPEPGPDPESFSSFSMKSKKDKKKADQTLPFHDDPEAARQDEVQPVAQENFASVQEDAATTAPEETQHSVENQQLDLVDSQRTVDANVDESREIAPLSAQPADEVDSYFPITTKKSKKDKKKAKKGFSSWDDTDDAQAQGAGREASLETAAAGDGQNTADQGNDGTVNEQQDSHDAVTAQDDFPATDDPKPSVDQSEADPDSMFPASTKKSKKDKKKAKKQAASWDDLGETSMPVNDPQGMETAQGDDFQQPTEDVSNVQSPVDVAQEEASSTADVKAPDGNGPSSEAAAFDVTDTVKIAPLDHQIEPEPGSMFPVGTKKSIKDRKKAKRDQELQYEDVAEAGTERQLPIATTTGDIQPIDHVPDASNQPAEEPTPDEFWAPSSSKKSKKDKKKAKKGQALPEDLRTGPEIAPDETNPMEQADKLTDIDPTDTHAVQTTVEPEADDVWGTAPSKKSKKDKKKGNKATVRTPEPAQEDELPAAIPSDETQEVDTTVEATALEPLEETTPEEQAPSAANEERAIDITEQPARDTFTQDNGRQGATPVPADHDSNRLSPSQDIDFAATLAAGLSESGFDPNLVVDDPVFHRRQSPPNGGAEADPEEFFSTTTAKKAKKGKKSKKLMEPEAEGVQSEPPKQEPIEPVEEPFNAQDDFDDVLAQSLQGGGFSEEMLREAAAASGSNESFNEVTGEAGEFSFAQPKRKKGKKSKATQPSTEVDQPAIESRIEPLPGTAGDILATEQPHTPIAESDNTCSVDAAEAETAQTNQPETLMTEQPASTMPAMDTPEHALGSAPGDVGEDEWAVPTKKKKGKKGKKDKEPIETPITPIEDEVQEPVLTEPLPPTNDTYPAPEEMIRQAIDTGDAAQDAQVDDATMREGNFDDWAAPTSKKKGKKGKKRAEVEQVSSEQAPQLSMGDTDTTTDRQAIEPSPPAERSATRPTDETGDPQPVVTSEMDVDEMDQAYRAYKKNKRNKKKQKALAAQSGNTTEAEQSGPMPLPETQDNMMPDVASQPRVEPEPPATPSLPDAARELPISDQTSPSSTSKVQSLFPGLQRVKRRTPSLNEASATKPDIIHSSEVAQSPPAAVEHTPEQSERQLEHEDLTQARSTDDAPAWSFDSVPRVPETVAKAIMDDNTEHEIARDSGYQEGSVKHRSTDSEAQTPASRGSLRERRSQEPLHVETEYNDRGSDQTPRQSPSERSRGLQADGHLRTPSSNAVTTPLEPMTKNRASYLFQSPPAALREDVNNTTPAETSRSAEIDQSQSGETDNTSTNRSAMSPPPGPLSPRTPLAAIPEERPASKSQRKRSKAATDVGSPPHDFKASKYQETPEELRNRSFSPLQTPNADSHIGLPQIGNRGWAAVHRVPFTVNDNPIASNTSLPLQHKPSQRAVSDQRSPSVMSNRSNVSGSYFRNADEMRSYSRTSNRSATPSLRRMDRSASGDLRSAARRSEAGSGSAVGARSSPKTIPFEPPPTPPLQDEDVIDGGASRAAGMADVYQGYGDASGSQVSPTRPPSMRKRQSMHIMDLESRMEQLVDENRALHEAQQSSGQRGFDQHHGDSQGLQEALDQRDLEVRERDNEIARIKMMLEPMQAEINRLNEINGGLTEANRNLVDDTNGRYGTLQAEHAEAHQQWQSASRELETMRQEHGRLTTGMRGIVEQEIQTALSDKNSEIRRLREELEIASERIRALQVQIQGSKAADFLLARDEDYFDGACQKLCQHAQQWVLRFSKLSDNRICRLSSDIRDEKIEARLDNAILDGTDVDKLLGDRVRRRDVFMSVLMTMIWEYVFTRYLFGMDREQRQKLKALEKILSEVGPPRAVATWRATTLTLLSKRPAFASQCGLDTEAVANEIFGVLCTFLPPPSNSERQLLESLTKVVSVAVGLSIEMRTQRAEFIMLPPLQPEYDTNGDLVRKVHFNAALMNERSGHFPSNEQLESERAVVKIVLFPLVVKKGDESGEGEEEIVVCPAQVLVQNLGGKERKVVRVLSGAMDIDSPRGSRRSLISTQMGEGSVGF